MKLAPQHNHQSASVPGPPQEGMVEAVASLSTCDQSVNLGSGQSVNLGSVQSVNLGMIATCPVLDKVLADGGKTLP